LKKGGHFVKMKAGYTPADIRYTTKGKAIYAIQLGWPGPKHETVLSSFSKQGPAGDVKVNKVSMLGSAEDIVWAMRDDGLAVSTPSAPPHELAVVYKIETDAIAEVVESPTSKGGGPPN
jgi:alpha-L-fucosidase